MACLTESSAPGAQAHRLEGVLSLQCLALAEVESRYILQTSNNTDDHHPEIFETKTNLLVKLSEPVFNECHQLLLSRPFSHFITPEFCKLNVWEFDNYLFHPQAVLSGCDVKTFGDKALTVCPYPYHYTNLHCPYKSLTFMGWEFHDKEMFHQFISYKIVIFALKYREFFDGQYNSIADYDVKVLRLEEKIRKYYCQSKELKKWLKDYTFNYKKCDSDNFYSDEEDLS